MVARWWPKIAADTRAQTAKARESHSLSVADLKTAVSQLHQLLQSLRKRRLVASAEQPSELISYGKLALVDLKQL